MLSDLYSVDSGPQSIGSTFPWLKPLQTGLGEGIGLSMGQTQCKWHRLTKLRSFSQDLFQWIFFALYRLCAVSARCYHCS